MGPAEKRCGPRVAISIPPSIEFYHVLGAIARLPMGLGNSKAVGGTRPTALPCPPYVPCSWTAIVGLSDRSSIGIWLSKQRLHAAAHCFCCNHQAARLAFQCLHLT
jgi:hypothetical protein